MQLTVFRIHVFCIIYFVTSISYIYIVTLQDTKNIKYK